MGRLTDRIERLEQQAAGIPGGGCPTCATWKAYPVTGGDVPPVQGWPADFRCTDCGREPVAVFRIRYEDRPLAAAKGAWPWPE